MKKESLWTKSHTIHLGTFIDNDHLIDEVLLSFLADQILHRRKCRRDFMSWFYIYSAANYPNPYKKWLSYCRTGEFTFRAFMNGKMDLSQAEAVADLISSSNESHINLPNSNAWRFFFRDSGFASRADQICFFNRAELDFSTEDVEFADRSQLQEL